MRIQSQASSTWFLLRYGLYRYDSSYGKSPVAKMEPDYLTPGLYFRGKFKSLIGANFSGLKGSYAGEESGPLNTTVHVIFEYAYFTQTAYSGMSISDNQYITIYYCRHENGLWGQHFTFCGSTTIFSVQKYHTFVCIICIMFLILCIFVTYVLCTK